MIRNVTTGKIVVSRSCLLTSLFAQATGLMFRKTLVDEGWVFVLPKKSRWDITNLFVFQDILVVWLDENKRVHKKTVVPAWTLKAQGMQQSLYFIELPPICDPLVHVGDVLSWDEKRKRI